MRLLFASAALFATAHAYNNGLALTPQMGWNSWNHFGCGISEDTILSAAKAVVQHNLTSLGYNCTSTLFVPVASVNYVQIS